MKIRKVDDKNIGETKHWLRTASTLMEALPYLRAFSGHTFVIKYGGNAMGDDELASDFARDVVLIKQVGVNPIVVHGGGPQIGEMLKRVNIQSEFVDGLRVTDQESVDIVEMVLAGSINKHIVTSINEAGGKAIGLSGKDGRLIEARKLRRTKRDPDSNIEKILDLGYVGEPQKVNADVFKIFEGSDAIPVIAPIGVGSNGKTYNINADTAAGAIAEAVNASKLLMLTDIAGVMNGEGELISEMTRDEANRLFKTSAITGGMIPKLETCLHAMEGGVEAAHILDGRVPHVLLLELFTQDGTGTKITL
ncbi:MAG: acetylglutamate kinase [Pseudomonadota bacterium]